MTLANVDVNKLNQSITNAMDKSANGGSPTDKKKPHRNSESFINQIHNENEEESKKK